MNCQPPRHPKRGRHAWLVAATLWAAGTASFATAQGPSAQGVPTMLSLKYRAQEVAEQVPPPAEIAPPPTPVETAAPGPVTAAAGCATCGGCVPGRLRDCCGCNRDTVCGRLFCGFYEELCCPDPCYEPTWIPAANSAFFVEGTRPVTTTRIRWDFANDFTRPDRSEFFWAKIGAKGPGRPETSLNYSELSLYQEVAAKGFSGFIEIPYLTVDPHVNPLAAGFGDMKIGTKSLLFDRDLFQIGFMFKTYLPVGNFSRGLGTGHVSLEPSLLATLKLTPDTYFQSQLSEWVPVGSDTDAQGSILHYHFSLNQVLLRPVQNVQLIGTGELNCMNFQAGQYTDSTGVVLNSHPGTYLMLGPGLRLVVCQWLDFGFGSAFAVGSHGPDQIYRTEMRIRY